MLQGHQPEARQAGLTALLPQWPFRTTPRPRRWGGRGGSVYRSFSDCKWKQPLFLSFLEEKPEEKIRSQRGHIWGCQQNWQGHTCKQRPLPRTALSLKQENSNPSFWKLLGNPGSLSVLQDSGANSLLPELFLAILTDSSLTSCWNQHRFPTPHQRGSQMLQLPKVLAGFQRTSVDCSAQPESRSLD